MSNHKIEIRRSNVEKILLGAEKVFAEKGFAGTAMADIAAQVQLPPVTPVSAWLTLAPVTPELLWLVTVTV